MKAARGVHAHQPVGQTAAAGAFVKRVVVSGGAQFLEALADGRVGHRGDPQPPDRLFAARHAVDVAEDQFALARRVGCADDLGGVLVVHQLFDDGELAARGGQHLQGDVLRQNGQIVHAPAAITLVQLVRLHEGNEVAQRPCYNVTLAHEAAVAPLGGPQHAGDVAPHRRFFGDDHDVHTPKHTTKRAVAQAALFCYNGWAQRRNFHVRRAKRGGADRQYPALKTESPVSRRGDIRQAGIPESRGQRQGPRRQIHAQRPGGARPAQGGRHRGGARPRATPAWRWRRCAPRGAIASCSPCRKR